ncbi:MAG: hypothetical protein FJZ97_13040, partial [Chloroflexi bacterium]|nr:hypothetical protein [Chloroflexota bacterium]
MHAITLHGIRPDTRYRVRITAAERGGATAEAEHDLTSLIPSPRREKGRGGGRVPLELLRLGGRDLAGMPLTFGVPLAQGKLVYPPNCLLRCEGQELPAQARVHARWPDGSARWILADLPCPQALAASPRVAAELLLRPRDAGAATGDPAARGLHWRAAEGGIVVEGEFLRVSVAADGQRPCRIERRAGDGWREVFASNGNWLEAELGNGLRVANGKPKALALEEAGPERAVIRYELPLADERGTIHFRSTVRLHIHARMPFVRVVLRTVVVSPALGPAFGGKDLSHLTPDLEYLRSAVAGAEGEATSLLKVAALRLRLPWHGAAAEEPWRVVHEHDRGYTVESAGTRQHREGHWPGFTSLRGEQGPLALCVKHFWQTCPKGVSYDGEQLWLEPLPRLSGEPLPDYDELWHKLYFWYDQGSAGYRLKAGLALTTEFLVGFPQAEEDPARWQEWLERPVAARPDLAYLNETAALLPIAAKAGSAWPEYEAGIDAAPAVWQRQLDERHEYGFLNFGDTYSDSEWFWSNNEYDAAFCQYVEFLRGGDPRWMLLAGPTVRHLVDVDSCNDPRHPEHLGAQYVHMPGHVGGYLPPYFRSKVAGSGSVPSHSW